MTCFAITALALILGFLAGERAAFRASRYFGEHAFASLGYWGRFLNANWTRP